MEEICYLISDASKKVDVETHVLRYWEEELGLAIPRNEMGHRYYTEFHIRLFCQVKALRDKGYQLKAIKSALQQLMEKNQEPVNAEEILEQDISRTLQENPRLGVLYRISVDKSGATRKVIEEQLLRREPSNIARLQDYSRLEKGSWNGEENRAVEKTENQTEIEEKSQEIEEKDGQTEMKNKRKSRTKPSAWERRNGIVVKVKPTVGENTAEEKELLRRDMEAAETGTKPVLGGEKLPEKGTLLEERKPPEKGLLLEERKPSEKEELLQGEGSLAGGESLAKGELFIEEGAPTENELDIPAETEIVLAQEKAELDRMTAKEKMEQFQAIMNQIIQRALEANNEKLSQDISAQVNQELAEELKSLMQIRNEQEEERFRHLDEMIRSCQRESQGKAEAAAARVPFFRKKWFEKGADSKF